MSNVNISISIDRDLLAYVDEVAEINGRSRSGMISWFLKQERDKDIAIDVLNEELLNE